MSRPAYPASGPRIFTLFVYGRERLLLALKVPGPPGQDRFGDRDLNARSCSRTLEERSDLLLEGIKIGVINRCDVERQKLRDHKAAHYGQTQRPA